MKTVDLEAIYDKHKELWFNNKDPYSVNSDADDYRINAMREACNQAIELCAENFMDTCLEDSDELIRQYILTTKDQIK